MYSRQIDRFELAGKLTMCSSKILTLLSDELGEEKGQELWMKINEILAKGLP